MSERSADGRDGATARPWIRADGQAKATGQARYTADLPFPGLAHARLLLAGRSHARIRRLDTGRARAIPGVLAVLTADDVPDRRYGSFDFVLDRTLFARDVVRFEGEVVAAVAALTPEIAAAALDAIEVDYEDLAADPRPGGGARARLAARPRGRRHVRPRSGARPGRQSRQPVDGREGRRGGRPRRRAGRRPRALRRGHGPSGPDRAPQRDRGLGGRPGDDLLEHPGAVPRPEDDRRGPRDPRAARPGRRDPSRRRVRRQVRLPLRGPRRRPGPRRPAAGPSRPEPARGVPGARQGDARDDRRRRDRPGGGRDDPRPDGADPPRLGRVRERHAGPRPDRRDDDRRALPDPRRRHRGDRRSTRTGRRPGPSAPRPGHRPAGRSSSTTTSSPPGSAWTRSSSAGGTS